ncbi:hypothetical protein C8R44DRAFT_991901 [Mycena epipterygia]|nr:hypothetical protein C8R44DRAFT_991901 [Mycena epipterygia]
MHVSMQRVRRGREKQVGSDRMTEINGAAKHGHTPHNLFRVRISLNSFPLPEQDSRWDARLEARTEWWHSAKRTLSVAATAPSTSAATNPTLISISTTSAAPPTTNPTSKLSSTPAPTSPGVVPATLPRFLQSPAGTTAITDTGRPCSSRGLGGVGGEGTGQGRALFV